MKIRQGFVSNSSASSFIIAIGKVVDRKKFDSFIETIDMRVIDGFNLTSIHELTEDSWPVAKVYKDGKIKIEAFEGSEVCMTKESYEKADEGKDVIDQAIMSLAGLSVSDIVAWHSGREDISEDNDGEYNFDIDLDHFSDDEQKLYEGLNEENGVVLVEKTFGAGYNG